MLSLDDLPPEVILERVLPQLPLKDLLSLSATSKTFHDLCVSPLSSSFRDLH